MDFTYPNLGSTSSLNSRQQQPQMPSLNNRQQQPQMLPQVQHHHQYPYSHGQPVGPPYGRPPPPIPAGPATRVGIKVMLKPQYRLTPLPQLMPLLDDIPANSFQFDFDLERRILNEAENSLSLIKVSPPVAEDPVITKYTSTGLSREAVVLALATYGDIRTKVIDFVSSYEVLREMGFEPEKIARALAMYDNDRERASAHLIG